jgi:hypothetical protein
VDIQKKLPAGGSRKIALGQWIYRNSVPSLGSYWALQLAEELTNLPGRSFTLVSGGSADLIISGEIVEVPGSIRVYTRLILANTYTVEASIHSDFSYSEDLARLLAGGGDGDAPLVFRDLYETDSRENPVPVEIAAGGEGFFMDRTLHDQNDRDFFLIQPGRDGTVVMETSGDTDTMMELFDAASGRSLASDDDDGPGANAQIRYAVQAENRYIIQVRGYSGETGRYGFRAYFGEEVLYADPDEYENDDDFSLAKDIPLGTAQRHTFHVDRDIDWVKFTIGQAGSYNIAARGIDADVDTYIELFDSEQNYIDDDDDSGDSLDAWLSLRLQAGTYYLKVKCLDDEPEAPYTITVEQDRRR